MTANFYSYYFSSPELVHDNPELKKEDLTLKTEHISFMIQMMAFSEWLCARSSLIKSPVAYALYEEKENELGDNYYEAMAWMIELLEENNIEYTLNYFEMYKEIDGLKKYSDFLSRSGFYLEFQGQTWCPYFGFKARETLIHIDNKVECYQCDEKSNCSIFKPLKNVVMQERIIDLKEMAFRLKYSKENSRSEVKEKLSKVWSVQKLPRLHTNVQLVEMIYDKKSWALPVSLPFESASINFKQLVPEEESPSAFAKTQELVFPKPEISNGLHAKQTQKWNSWSQDYLQAWQELQQESQPGQGEEVKFVDLVGDEKNIHRLTSLYLDLSSVQTAQKLFDFWGIKDARFFIATPNATNKFNRELQFDDWSEQSLTMIFKDRPTLACLDYERLVEMCWQKESAYKGPTYAPELYSWSDQVSEAEFRWTGGQLFKMQILDPLVELYLKKELKSEKKKIVIPSYQSNRF